MTLTSIDARRSTNPGTILGCDFAGIVVQTGPNLRVPLKVGDKVAASLRGGVDKERGGFAEYVKVYADLAWIIPEGTYTFEEAATIGIPLYTSVIALYGPNSLQLPQPGDANPPVPGTWVSEISASPTETRAHDLHPALRLWWKLVCWTICNPTGQALRIQCCHDRFKTQPRTRQESWRGSRLRCKQPTHHLLGLALIDLKHGERSTTTPMS